MSVDPKEAVEFMRESSDAESNNRQEGLSDLRFRYGDQWPIEITNSRRLQDRPCLTINELDAYCRKVENDERLSRPRIVVHATNEQASEQIAKTLSGLMRHIWNQSDADYCFDLAYSFSMTMGWGYVRMLTDFVREDSFDQEIYMCPVENPFTVYFDKNSSLPDGSDAERCLITDMMKKEDFKRRYRGANLEGFTQSGTGDSIADWDTKDDIRIAEYFYIDRTNDKLVMLSDGTIVWRSNMPAPESLSAMNLNVVRERDSLRSVVKWCKQTCYDILEEKIIPGRYIPVVPVYGNSIFLDGRRIRFGMVRFAKDPQKMVNYWQTALTEAMALAPKAKWLLAAGQDDGYENEWAQANVSPRPVLHYNRFVEAQDMGIPERVAPEPPQAGLMQATMGATQSLARVLGIYDPAVQQSRLHKSDETINAETQQTDKSNLHYFDNLTRSIKHCGRIALDWIPKIYDTQRVQRIIGDDGRHELVTLNEKIKDKQGAIQRILNDVTIGQYDVVMDTGPGFDSKRQEAVSVFTEMMNTPMGEKIVQVADDVVMRNLDVPGSDIIADRMAAANPLSQIDEKSDIPPQAQMVIKTLQTNLQKAQQMMQQMGLEIKYRTSIEQMRQAGEDKRELMRMTTKAHDIEKQDATKRHDVETRAVTAQNVAEIDGIVKLFLAHIDTHQLEKEIAARNAEQQAQANESEPVNQ